MNERIKDLMAQAEKFADITHLDTVGDGFASDWHALMREKFAELIIKECNNVVLSVPCYYKDYRSQIEEAVINDCGRAVLEHFGVTQL